MKLIHKIIILTALIASGHANATIVNHADVSVNGNIYGAFLDEDTGYVWLDLNNFFSTTHDDVHTAVAGSTFHMANWAELQELGISVDASLSSSMTFEAATTIIGGIAGSDSWYGHLDYVYPTGYRVPGGWGAYSISHDGRADTGAWVVSYTDPGAVPIPAAVWLFTSGLFGLIGIARRKKA